MRTRANEVPAVTPEAILEELNKVLSSLSFKGSERSCKLLRFLVERTVAGQHDRLKEYTLGTEALGKGHSFDPRIDPSVRSEVSRLRTRLDKYYAAEGQTDLIVITLPKGGYVPRFQSRAVQPVGIPGVVEKQPSPAVSRLRAPLAILAGVSIVAAIAFVSYRGYAFSTPGQGVVAERAASASEASAVSVAVLPFLNLSGDASQEFFSDGMTEEITAALAKIRDLKVVARTSAFQFKAQNRDIQSIGQQLHATHLIEGSVRKEGDRVRIIAQLIEAKSGIRLSSESYDGKISDIFDTQEQIARTIVRALMSPLGLEQGEQLVNNRSIDPESYQQYLRARALVRARGIDSLTQAADILEQVVARDSNFAPAWALLAQAYALTPVFHPAVRGSSVDELRRVVDGSLPRADLAARRAISLDPNDADAYLSLGLVQDERGKFQIAEELYAKALVLDPNNPDGLHRKGLLLAEVGHVKEALTVMQELRAVEPFVPVYNANVASVMMLNKRDDEARVLLKTLPPDTAIGLGVGERLAELNAAAGRYNEAIDELRSLPREAYPPNFIETAVHFLRTAGAVPEPQDHPYLGTLSFVYLYVGATDRVLDVYDKNLAAVYLNALVTISLWHPSLTPVRKTAHFKKIVRNAGLIDYWREKGWPEFCHPVGADDFACD